MLAVNPKEYSPHSLSTISHSDILVSAFHKKCVFLLSYNVQSIALKIVCEKYRTYVRD